VHTLIAQSSFFCDRPKISRLDRSCRLFTTTVLLGVRAVEQVEVKGQICRFWLNGSAVNQCYGHLDILWKFDRQLSIVLS
jgi:hypothetical protein